MIERLIVASLLAADFANVAKEVRRTEQAGADRLHLDIMDGMFVPNISFGPGVVGAVRPHTTLPFDVHLMVTRPINFVDAFKKAGAERLIVHLESQHPDDDPRQIIKAIHASGLKVGLAINPATSIEKATFHFEEIDLLLIMTVHPGFGGQEFISATVEKIEAAYVCRETYGFSFRIGVDGGINAKTAESVLQAGADLLVCGTSLFTAPNMPRAIRELRSLPARESATATV